MSRQKKTRRITDIMPTRKADKKPTGKPLSGKKLTRYELDAKAREEKRKRKHKGLSSGSRHSLAEQNNVKNTQELKDPRIGSRKKVPLMVEWVNDGKSTPQKLPVETVAKPKALAPEIELERLENNEILNELLDQLDEGKTLSVQDQQFVDECLDRIAQLMEELGIEDEEDDNPEDLYRKFETIDINQFK